MITDGLALFFLQRLRLLPTGVLSEENCPGGLLFFFSLSLSRSQETMCLLPEVTVP